MYVQYGFSYLILTRPKLTVYQHKLSNFLFTISMIHFCVMPGPFLSMSERRHSEVARLYEADLYIEEQ
jgi:hypothetical protein